MSVREVRKLSAIMFTDIKGYTALVQQDEGLALRTVDKFRSILEKYTADYNGKVIEFYGDGSLSTYDSVIDCINCAISMQKEYRQDLQVPVRVGLHFGDIVFRDGTVYGDGVNLASRIESQGTPGSILMSSKVKDELFNHPQLKTKSVGSFKLKNVKEKQHIFALDHPDLVMPKHLVSKAIRIKNFKRIAWGLAIVLGVLGIGTIANNGLDFSSNNKTTLEETQSARIAVPSFKNFTFVDSLEIFGDIAADYLTRGLMETKKANVMTFRSDQEMQTIFASVSASKSELPSDVVNIIEGSYSRTGTSPDSIEITAYLKNQQSGRILHNFKTRKGPVHDPMLALQKLKNEVNGYWESKDDKLTSPPTHTAYKYYLAAKNNWMDDYDAAEKQLLASVKADPTFIDPVFHLLTLYSNQEQYDSMAVQLKKLNNQKADLNEHQKNYLYYFEADLQGKSTLAFNYYRAEYEEDRQDLFVNTNFAVLANDYVNAPEIALSILEEIPLDRFDYEHCTYCVERLYQGMMSSVEIANLKKAKAYVDLMPKQLPIRRYFSGLLRYYAHRDDTSGIRQVFQRAEESDLSNNFNQLKYNAAREFKLLGDVPLTNYYANLAIKAFDGPPSRSLARAFDIKGEYAQALEMFNQLIAKDSTHLLNYAYAGVLNARLGNSDEAKKTINGLLSRKTQYDYGTTPYLQGRILLHLGQENQALDKLQQAIDEGAKFYAFNWFDTDPDLIPLFNNARFQKMIHPLEN